MAKFFVGRQTELKTLHQYADEAFIGQSTIIGLRGTAGSGKSSLLRQFISELEGKEEKNLEVLTGHCIDTEAMPYLPFVEALRKYLKVSGVDQTQSVDQVRQTLLGISKDIVGLAPVVGPLLTVGVSIAEHVNKTLPPSQMEMEQSKLFHAVAAILSAMAEKKHVVVALEDMHLADRSSLHLMQYLATSLQDKHILLLLTTRLGVQDKDPSPFVSVWTRLVQKCLAYEIPLNDFGTEDFEIYLRETFQGETVSEDVRKALFSQTHGNPFFLSQILPVLLQEGLLVKEGQVWKKRDFDRDLRLPASVEATVQEIFQTLAPDTQSTLEVAAVIGERFEVPLLASANDTRETALDQQLDLLTERHVVTEIPEVIDVYGFVHAIVRDIVYRKMATRRRRRVHLKVAQTIEQMYRLNKWAVLETLAYHYRQSGETAKAIEHYLDAAGKAITLGAQDEALRSYQHILDMLPENDVRLPGFLEIAGELADHTSQWQLARTFFQRLLAISTERNDKKMMGIAYEGIASVDFREGKWSESEKGSQEHLRISDQIGDMSGKAFAVFNLGRVYWRTGQWNRAKSAYEEALQIQEQLHLNDRILATIAMLGVIYRNQGLHTRALELYQQGINLYEKLSTSNQAVGADREDSSAQTQQNILIQYWLGTIYNNQGTALRSIAAEENAKDSTTESPYWDRSLDAYRKSLEITEKIGSLGEMGNTHNNIANLYRSRPNSDFKKAMEYCYKAKKYLDQIDAPVDWLENLRIMGAIQVQLGEIEEGRKNLEESLATANRIGAPDRAGLAHIELGTAYRHQRNFGMARKHYEIARELFAKLGADWRVNKIDQLLHEIDE